MKKIITLVALMILSASTYSQCGSGSCQNYRRHTSDAEYFHAFGSSVDNPQGEWWFADFRIGNLIDFGDIKTAVRFRPLIGKKVEGTVDYDVQLGAYYPVTINEGSTYRNFLVLGANYVFGKENFQDQTELTYYLLDSLGNYQGKKIETISFDKSNKYELLSVYVKSYLEHFVLSAETSFNPSNNGPDNQYYYRLSIGYTLLGQRIKPEINYQKNAKFKSAQGLAVGFQANIGLGSIIYNYNFKGNFTSLGLYFSFDHFTKKYRYARYNESRLAILD